MSILQDLYFRGDYLVITTNYPSIDTLNLPNTVMYFGCAVLSTWA